MENYLVVWPKSKDVIHINYHYTDFGEIVDYLNGKFPNQVLAVDCDIDNVKDITQIIKDYNIQKVAMMVNYENVENAFKMADEISQGSKIPVMAYGNLTVNYPHLFFNSNFNAIYGSGDYQKSIEMFFNTDPSLGSRKGLISINGSGSYQVGDMGEFIDPDEWGYAKPSQVPVFEYDGVKNKNRYVLNISRGCPFSCKHCLIQMVEGRKERRRSIENVDRALADITQDYKHIKIWAANFTLDKHYVMQFCDVLKKYPDVTWECATRIDLLKDETMIQAMAEAGCRQISIGIESLNSGKFIESKKFSQTQVEEIIKRIQKFGINVKGCVMLGIPGQTKQDIVDTLKFLKDNNVSTRPTVFTPYHACAPKNIQELTSLNRKTYRNDNVEGISPEQLIKLTKDPFNYEAILEEKEQFKA